MEFKMFIKICKETVTDVINSSGLAEISIHSANTMDSQCFLKIIYRR